MPIQVGDSDISPKRVRITVRSPRGHWTLALRPMRDANGRQTGYQPFLAPEGVSAMSEAQCIAWAERLIDAAESSTSAAERHETTAPLVSSE
jgi:hypothetical protein